MQPIRQTRAFSNGEASFGGPPGGFVWSVQLNVPTATNSDTFQLYINGEQLTSAAGTGLMGPVQVFSGETITIKSSTVAAGTKAFLYGQVDKQGQQPSGIFPVISGGVVTTSGGGYPLSTPQSGQLTSQLSVPAGTLTTVFTSGTLAVGTWLLTFVYVAQNANCDGKIALGTATGTITGTSSGSDASAAAGVTIICLVEITAEGTVDFVVESPAANTILDGSQYYGFPGATGWTATRVA